MTAHDADRIPAIMTVPEAARFLKIGRTAAYEAIRTGQLPALRLGRKLRVSRAAVQQALLVRTHGDHRLGGAPLTNANDPELAEKARGFEADEGRSRR